MKELYLHENNQYKGHNLSSSIKELSPSKSNPQLWALTTYGSNGSSGQYTLNTLCAGHMVDTHASRCNNDSSKCIVGVKTRGEEYSTL